MSLRDLFLRMLITWLASKPPKAVESPQALLTWYRYAPTLVNDFLKNLTALNLLADAVEIYEQGLEKLEDNPGSEEVLDYLERNRELIDQLACVFGESSESLGLE